MSEAVIPLPALLLFGLAAALALAVMGVLLYDRRRLVKRQEAVLHRMRAAIALYEAGGTAWLYKDADGRWSANPKIAEWIERPATDAAALLLEKAPEIAALSPERPSAEKIIEANGRTLRLEGAMAPAPLNAPVVAVTDATGEMTERKSLIQDFQSEHQRLERALSSSDIVLSATPFPIWRRDKDLAITWVNQAYAQAVGSSCEEAVRQQTELIAGPMMETLREEAKSAALSGEPQTAKHFIIMGGQRRAIEVNTIPLAGGSGTVSYAVDATEVQDLKAEIARLDEAHRETLNTMTTAVAIFAPNKALNYYNHAFASLWNLSDEWLDTHPPHEEILEALRDKRRLPEQADFKIWKDERLSQYTSVIETEEEIWHLPDSRTLRVVIHPHPTGGLLILYEDVTDRLALERSFNTLIAVQRETLNKLYEAVAVFSSDGHLRLFNPTYAEIWKLNPELLESCPHVTRIVEELQPLFHGEERLDSFQRAILGETEHRETKQGRLQRNDGRVIDYSSVPLPDGGTLMTYLDVTDRLRIEHALMERNEALQTADRLKSEFIAHTSYELRTPLNTIIGFSELLQGQHFGPLNEKQSEYVDDILHASEQLRRVISDIFDIAMVEAGTISLDLENLRVSQLLKEVSSLCDERAKAKDLTLTISCPRNVGSIEGDRNRLIQVLYNLASNALKYTPEGGSITLGARRRKDDVDLFVQDTGIGISEQEREKVFQKFHTAQGDGSRGMGLGLALVRSFVEMHHGHVELESEPGKGTRVICTIPRHQAHDEAEPAPLEEESRQSVDAAVSSQS